MVWAQLLAVGKLAWPVLNGSSERLFLTSDFSIDKLSALFSLLTALVVACALSHANVFFENEESTSRNYSMNQERMFYASSSLFLLAMTFVFICDNLGFLWISIEATTLTSAALVYFGRTKHALEATWKYLVICSVGIAFALLGTILIFASSQHGAFPHGSLNLLELSAHAADLQYPLLRLGFIFCLVGYGTKAGIFPLHSWLPDAHSEAPAPASAMLSGALLNCALFAIWRISQLVNSAHHGNLVTSLDLTAGTLTALTASLFLVHQHGLKRLWAYSSIENVGIMLVAIGLGSGPLFFLHAFNHSVSKVALFLLSGNVIQATGTKKLSEIRGLLGATPSWAVLIVIMACAVTGAPPFGAFLSEWLILLKGLEQGQYFVVAALVLAITVSFVAVANHVCSIVFGHPKENQKSFKSEATSIIPAGLAALSLACGITSIPLFLLKP